MRMKKTRDYDPGVEEYEEQSRELQIHLQEEGLRTDDEIRLHAQRRTTTKDAPPPGVSIGAPHRHQR